MRRDYKYLILLMIVGAPSCLPRHRRYSMEHPTRETYTVYYPNGEHPPIPLTFAPGIPHVEPDDEGAVNHAAEMCPYFVGPESYPLRVYKKGLRDYQTVCRNPEGDDTQNTRTFTR